MTLLSGQVETPWLAALGLAAAAHAAALGALLVGGGEAREVVPEPVMVVELAEGAAPPQPSLAPQPAASAALRPAAARAVATPIEPLVAHPTTIPLPAEPLALRPRPQPREIVAPAPQASPSSAPATASLALAPRPTQGLATGTGASGGGPGADPAAREARNDWYALISAHLERQKRYPREAKAAGQQGTPVVRFSVDRRGRVSDIAIAGSSGHALLDEATIELLRRAAPLPPMPRAIGRESVTITLPIEYSLSRK